MQGVYDLCGREADASQGFHFCFADRLAEVKRRVGLNLHRSGSVLM